MNPSQSPQSADAASPRELKDLKPRKDPKGGYSATSAGTISNYASAATNLPGTQAAPPPPAPVDPDA